MKYVFRVNHKLVTIEEFYQALMDHPFPSNGDREEKMHEVFETGSFTAHYDTFSIEVAK